MCEPTPELRAKARDWMQQLVNEPEEENPELWDCDGTILRTPLGEACANALDLAMDDAEATIPEWVWDLAHEVAEWWEADEDEDEDDNDCDCDDPPFVVEPSEDLEGFIVVGTQAGLPLGDELGTLIYLERHVAERAARAGKLLYQVETCSCGWKGTSHDTDETGECPDCGERDTRCSDEWVFLTDLEPGEVVPMTGESNV